MKSLFVLKMLPLVGPPIFPVPEQIRLQNVPCPATYHGEIVFLALSRAPYQLFMRKSKFSCNLKPYIRYDFLDFVLGRICAVI